MTNPMAHVGLTFLYESTNLEIGVYSESGYCARCENGHPLGRRPARNVGRLGPNEESLQQLWVELTLGGPHDFGGPRVGQSGPVRAGGGQRVVDVSDAQNP